MNEMRKLMEAVEQLNEYLVRKGDPIKNLLYLNVFGDTGHIDRDGIVYGPKDVSWEEGEIDPELQQEWLRQVKPYAEQAGQLKKTILKISSKGRKLTDAEADAAEQTWYDGGDLYNDLELAFDELPAIWENQIGIIHEILAGEVHDDEGDYAAFGEANQGGTTETQVSEGASSQQWETAINNLIGDGEEQFGRESNATRVSGQAVWEWVMGELHGMLDFQPDSDDGGLERENVVGRNLRRAFGETIEQINEVSDFDGESLDALIAQFEETCKEFRIGSFPRKQIDLLNVVKARAKDTQDLGGLGHENTLGHDHSPNFGGWPNKQR